MRDKVIIIRWCEIHLKGKNRSYFAHLLEENLQRALKNYKHDFKKIDGRYLIENFSSDDTEDIIEAIKKVSGAHTCSIATRVKSDIDAIIAAAKELVVGKAGSFKVETKRADKKFPIHSVECSKIVGGECLSANPKLSVDVHAPDFTVFIDIRDSGDALIYSDVIKLMGGMPSGSAGKGLLMISGGIDSPVAGYMMAKRGLKLDAIHFHSYPYTSEAAKQKVIDLTKILSGYTGGANLFVVPFTEIQESIHEKCPAEFMITMMRRFMMRIAEKMAFNCHAKTIITGESLGQVASQTVESITVSNNAVKVLPVLRPLIAFDKLDIIEISEKIGAYETSILPYEDCCTVFLPEHPVIKPKLETVLELEKRLDIDGLIANAFKHIEKYEL